MARAEAVTISERIGVCHDATDDKFFELAVNGKADVIVSGDADLLVLNPFRGVPIVGPASFVQGSAHMKVAKISTRPPVMVGEGRPSTTSLWHDRKSWMLGLRRA